MNTLSIGQKVNYKNGTFSVYTGTIISINIITKEIVVIDDDPASWELYNAGCKIGSCIKENQII